MLMQLFQALDVFDEGPVFGSDWSIQARDIMRLKADIDEIQAYLVIDCGLRWSDLPEGGRVYNDVSREDLTVRLKILRSMESESTEWEDLD